MFFGSKSSDSTGLQVAFSGFDCCWWSFDGFCLDDRIIVVDELPGKIISRQWSVLHITGQNPRLLFCLKSNVATLQSWWEHVQSLPDLFSHPKIMKLTWNQTETTCSNLCIIIIHYLYKAYTTYVPSIITGILSSLSFPKLVRFKPRAGRSPLDDRVTGISGQPKWLVLWIYWNIWLL